MFIEELTNRVNEKHAENQEALNRINTELEKLGEKEAELKADLDAFSKKGDYKSYEKTQKRLTELSFLQNFQNHCKRQEDKPLATMEEYTADMGKAFNELKELVDSTSDKIRELATEIYQLANETNGKINSFNVMSKDYYRWLLKEKETDAKQFTTYVSCHGLCIGQFDKLVNQETYERNKWGAR